MGSRLGALAVLAYLVEGALGLPVFSFGRSGLGMLFGLTGGYLMGYLLGAYTVGYYKERGRVLLGLVLGNSVIYLCGFSQLSVFVGIEKAFYVGILPFLGGDMAKLLISYRILNIVEKRD
jgi:biotin transport system substrate-specific component